jgi:hypothetical protein
MVLTVGYIYSSEAEFCDETSGQAIFTEIEGCEK